MPEHGSKPDISFAGRFTASAIAACFAEVCTIPLDTAKVRLQLQKNVAADAAPKYRGLLGTAATIAREEGAAALWKGIVPGLHRQCIYGGLRIGLYEPVKSFYVGKDHVGDVPLTKKIAAGFTTGAIAISIANPTDLVKVRLQAEGKLAPGAPRRYAGAMDAYAKIVRQVDLLLLSSHALACSIPTHHCLLHIFIILSSGRVCCFVDWHWTQCCAQCHHQCCRVGQL
jgi:solute carrier family 25 uncoupling protein 8/9